MGFLVAVMDHGPMEIVEECRDLLTENWGMRAASGERRDVDMAGEDGSI